MTTRFIGLKELRQTLTKVATHAQKHGERYIVLRKNEPMFELRPISKKEATLEHLMNDIAQAEKDVKAGRTYSQADVERMLGL